MTISYALIIWMFGVLAMSIGSLVFHLSYTPGFVVGLDSITNIVLSYMCSSVLAGVIVMVGYLYFQGTFLLGVVLPSKINKLLRRER